MSWYVVYKTAENGQKLKPMAGPFETKEEADQNVDETRRAAEKIDLFAVFYIWGMAKAKEEKK